MIDPNPPHGGIHSFKDFMVHLLAITIGLLIAFGLDGAVGWRHHRRLVREARANIDREIAGNQSELANELTLLPKEQGDLQKILDWAEARQRGSGPSSPPEFSWQVTRLNDGAWNAASATGATSYMSYGEVQGYEQLYFLQQLFNNLMNRYLDERLEMIALTSFGSAKSSERDLDSGRDAIFRGLVLNRGLDEAGEQLARVYSEFHSSSPARNSAP